MDPGIGFGPDAGVGAGTGAGTSAGDGAYNLLTCTSQQSPE